MRSYTEIPVLNNIPILVRAALNEPLDGNVVRNDFRLRRALPTLEFLQAKGARVIVISHISGKGTESLRPMSEALSRMITRVSFCEASRGPRVRDAVRKLQAGEILILENLRHNSGEEANDVSFAHELASLADVFIQDSFDTCHRAHASIVRLPQLLPSYAGAGLLAEVEHLTKALSPKSPSIAIIGGAKFSSKESVLERLLERYDKVFVGGALANDFLKARGCPVGQSLVSNAPVERIKKLLTNPRLFLPIDGRFLAPNGEKREARVEDIAPDEAMLDLGPETAELLSGSIRKSKSVLWSGPLGVYEKGFVETTDTVATAVVESGAYSVVGGGDTVAELERIGVLDRFSFVSIGGGAMLEFLARGTLPGIAALG